MKSNWVTSTVPLKHPQETEIPPYSPLELPDLYWMCEVREKHEKLNRQQVLHRWISCLWVLLCVLWANKYKPDHRNGGMSMITVRMTSTWSPPAANVAVSLAYHVAHMNLLSPALTCPPLTWWRDLSLSSWRSVWPSSDLCRVLSVLLPGFRKLLSNHMLLSNQPCEWHLTWTKLRPRPPSFRILCSVHFLSFCFAEEFNCIWSI